MTELIDYEIPQDVLRVGHCRMRVGNELVIDFYLRILSEGTPPRMAESLAMQQAPGIGITNAIFVQDQNRHGRTILDRMNGNPQQVEALKDESEVAAPEPRPCVVRQLPNIMTSQDVLS